MSVRENNFGTFELVDNRGNVIARSTHPAPLWARMEEIELKDMDFQFTN